jgi:hypothetical protein
MTLSTNLAVLFLGVFVGMGGCAGNTPPAAAPEPETAPAGEAFDASSATPHTLEVGMEFKEKDDSGQRRASRDAPPTGSWKPVDKDKSLDSKAVKK